MLACIPALVETHPFFTLRDAACRDDTVQVAAQELLAQFPAAVLQAALRGDQWREVLDTTLGADRDVAIKAVAADHMECRKADSDEFHCS